MLKHWFIDWLQPIAPVYERELARGEIMRPAMQGVKRSWRAALAYLWLAVAFFVCVLSLRGIYILLVGLPFIVLLFALVLRIRVVVAASDVIAHEVEAQTWDTLRLIPRSTERLVKTKLAAALIRSYRALLLLVALRVVFVVAVALLVLPASPPAGGFDAWWLLPWLYYGLEPLLDFIMDGALGVAISAFAHSQSQALVMGTALGAVGVSGQMLLDFIVVPAGSMGGTAGALAVLAVAVLRYVMLRGLLRLAVWRIAF